MAVRSAVRLLTSDGGILDPDDYVSDVVDDREQVNMRLVPHTDSLHIQQRCRYEELAPFGRDANKAKDCQPRPNKCKASPRPDMSKAKANYTIL